MISTFAGGASKFRRGIIAGVAASVASLAMVGTFAGVAHAATGNATAQAANVDLTGATTIASLNLGLGLGGGTSQAQAPATDGTATAAGGLNLTSVLANATVSVNSTTATRAGTTTSAQSTINSSGVNTFGTGVLTTGLISAAVTCPAGGTPTATVNANNVTVAGTPVNPSVPSTVNVPVSVLGLVGANLAVTVSSPHSTTATTATATGLLVQMTLTATTLVGALPVNLPLGTVALAQANCLSPDAAPPVNPPPTITGIAPNSGPTYGGQTVTITGTGFVAGQTNVSFGGLPATGVNVSSATSLTATTPVASAAGATNVTVTTPDGTSGPLAYTYVGPSISGINPDQGPTAGGQSVTITGSGFAPGAQVTIGGTPATGVTVNPAGTSIIATTPAGAAGPADVAIVQIGPDALLANGYTYIAPGAPTITGIDPDHGPIAGGQTVTITGTGFDPGSTAVSFDGLPGTQVTVNSSTSLTVATPAHAAGAVDVQVSNAFGDSGTRLYTYLAPAPPTPDPGPTDTPVAPHAVGGVNSSLPFTGFGALLAVAVGALLVSAGAWCAVVRHRNSAPMHLL